MKLFNQLLLTLASSLFSLTTTFGQLPAGSICLGNDTTVCQGQPVTIVNCPTGTSTGGSINLPSPTNVSLTDDAWSGVIPMGFSFSFYGNTYTSCLIGSNGIVSFNLASANGYCPWSLNGTPLPTTTVAAGMNAAMGCYEDLNPSNANSGVIQYQTIGTAPNRIFVVLYKGVTAFGCLGNCNFSSYLFYETSNNIEFYVGAKASCPTWNNQRAVQGTMDPTGTIAHITPGRNNSVWTANFDGKLFQPTSPAVTTAYTISNIPYVAVTSNGTSTPTQWKSTTNQTFPYNGTTNALTISNPPTGTTGYFLTGSGACSVSIGAISDTTWITSTSVSGTASSITDTCNQGLGSVTITPNVGTPPFTYNWTTIPGGNTATVNNVSTGLHTITITDALGCSGTTTIPVQNLTVSSSATSTLVSCAGGSDGTATATMTPSTPNSTYLWDDPAAQTTQTATGLSAGTYNCTITNTAGCVSIATVVVSEIPALTANIINQVDVDCHAANTGIITLSVTDGTAPYTYVWSGSTSTGPQANDLFVGPQSVDVTDANGCLVSLSTTLAEPAALYIDSMATDSMICSESSIVIGAVGAGGSTPYIYTWYENGTQISNAQYVTVDPVNSGTQYSVVLSEVCGSPTTADTLTLTFPTDIVPLATPIPYEACAPDSFLFTNTSTNGGEIASTVWQFSNGTVHTIPAQDSIKEFFEIAGMYDASMTVTSIYGCIYTNDFPQIISALQRPKAQFGMTTNPTTIFETKVGMIDKSIDASQWNWTAPMATPNTSTLQHPEFNFPPVVDKYEVLLTVTSPKGCIDTTRGVLDVQNDFILYAPNTFTPDGDQFNQTWHVVTDGLDVNTYEMTVYNRWGQVVWQSLDPSAEWDGTFAGKVVPAGNYNWKLRTKKSDTDEPQIFTGSVMIIR